MKIPNPCEHPVCLSHPPLLTDSAWLEHIPFAFIIVDLIRPTIFVELGTHTGLSYSAFCESVKKLKVTAKCYAIDTWSGDEHAGHYDQSVFERLQKFHDPAYGEFSELIQGTFDEVVDRFADGTIDLLHIDGLHTYEAVKHDFETWLPKLSNRSVVLFHDTNVRERNFGVWKLWEELQKKYPSFEFFHGYGLGVLKVGTETTSIDSLFELSSESAINFREFFSLLGKQINEKKEIETLKLDLSKRDTQLAERDAKIAERDAKIAERDAKIAERDVQLKKLANKILEITKSRLWFFISLSLRIEKRLLAIGSWQALLLDKITEKIYIFQNRRKVKDDLALLTASNFYDEAWYLKNYPDIGKNKITPVLHYLLHGGFEKRDPGPQFSSQWYLETYPDVLIAGYNPLIHYLKFGQKEGRKILSSQISELKIDDPDIPYTTEVESEANK